MLFAGREVRTGKTVPEVLSTPCSRPRTQFFPIQTDLSKQITCLLFSVGNYFIRTNCVDFLLQQFHTVRVRLKYVFFVWIIKFTFAMIAVIIHNCLTFCPMFTSHVDFQCYKKLLK